MAEKDLIIKEKVESSGIFEFSALYSFAHSWLKEEGYGVDEEKYSEKIKGAKKDIDIEWKAAKNVSDYFRFENKIKFEIRDLEEVEVEIGGKKKKTNNGKVTVEVTATLIKDRDSKWDTSPFSRFMRDVYNKYVISTRVSDYSQKVASEVRSFKEEIKSFLELSGKRK